ncbi:molybdenum cofactor synthesis domain-containing protein [Halanaerobium congolense]|uniref:Molybdenum cofactor synthesis domain-containing protein n=2 Tax=Halanaerobium congolense TaxID=54121 RepID=A0A1M7MAI9_9FIRM|nr:molybdopterin adenylyltransferase [Halanaerobium congolense]PXV62024.1 molybdopterin adenylyltransferase [Halanaerobium congolense]TDP13761.1 molybdopterin adenylyltransferase [Halanaerobium congolense]SDE96988.1 molybdenum cofactor synthesis domain-containing protein [Halanaerobium congolense]SDH42284.1 molybdenum cofactor synthesis domain-containing protein [Halanaerobium congolense]
MEFMSEKKADFQIRTAVLTISDKGARGERKDLSGPLIKEMMEEIGAEIVYEEIIADEKLEIKKALIEISDQNKADLILTTGGTGFAKRDITPEVTLEVIEKEVPGIPEKIRAETISITPQAALSRARAGIRKKTLIINFPGSPKAVRECLEAVIEIIPHGVKILKGKITEHKANHN